MKDSRLPDLMRHPVVSVDDVEKLLKEGAAINGVNNIGQSGLYRAASRGDGVRLLKVLLSRGADPNLPCFDGTTALHCAAILCPQSVALLIEHGARVNAQDVRGETPLHFAAGGTCGQELYRAEICEALLDRGADPNIQDKYGRTPIYYAMEKHWPDIVELLLKAGAEVDFDPAAVDKFPAAKRAALYALEVGYPAYVSSFGMGSFLKAIDPELGLPVRLNGDVVMSGGETAAKGHRAGIVEYTEKHGLPWNSRLPWLEWIDNPAKYFAEAVEPGQVVPVEMNGPAVTSGDHQTSIQLYDEEIRDGRLRHVRLKSQHLFPEVFHGWLSEYAQVTESGKKPPGRIDQDLDDLEPREFGLYGPGTYERLELAWGPENSTLAFFRFTNVLVTTISLRWTREETRPEVSSVLDLGLGEWLPGKTTFPH